MLLHCKIIKKNIELLTEAYLLLYLRKGLSDVQSVDFGSTHCWSVHASQHVNQGSLSGAVVAQYRIHLTLADTKIRFIHCSEIAEFLH